MNKELTNLFDSLPEGIVLIRQDTGKVTLANTEFKNLFKQCKGTTISDHNHNGNNE